MADDRGRKSSGTGWMVFLGLLGLGVLLQVLAPADPEGHGGHGFLIRENGFYIYDFIVLVVLLVWFVRRPLKQFLQQRRATLEREIDEARRLQAEARATVEEYERRLASMDADVEAIRARAREDGEALKARLVADGEALARKLIEDAEARVRTEAHFLRERLEAELVAAAVDRAEQVVRQGLTAERQRQFVQSYVNRIEQMAAAGRGGRA